VFNSSPHLPEAGWTGMAIRKMQLPVASSQFLLDLHWQLVTGNWQLINPGCRPTEEVDWQTSR